METANVQQKKTNIFCLLEVKFWGNLREMHLSNSIYCAVVTFAAEVDKFNIRWCLTKVQFLSELLFNPHREELLKNDF